MLAFLQASLPSNSLDLRPRLSPHDGKRDLCRIIYAFLLPVGVEESIDIDEEEYRYNFDSDEERYNDGAY